MRRIVALVAAAAVFTAGCATEQPEAPPSLADQVDQTDEAGRSLEDLLDTGLPPETDRLAAQLDWACDQNAKKSDQIEPPEDLDAPAVEFADMWAEQREVSAEMVALVNQAAERDDHFVPVAAAGDRALAALDDVVAASRAGDEDGYDEAIIGLFEELEAAAQVAADAQLIICFSLSAPRL
ncbi:hypothetical protein [Nitriliruptor alkaliphilus]|uniref:hypothetical protein n=1 Tax=Nitriliruptor alkaliphilus TaxID=427918 RepID=UPI000695B05C|nr:hypothetical protein [Nitriliruptor alkaliphilus]